MSSPLLLQLPMAAGVCGFSSTRVGGASQGAFDSLNLGLNTADQPQAVLANRAAALAAGGADPARAVYLRQVHGEGIQEATEVAAGKGSQAWGQGLADCDAAFTRTRSLPLCIGHADCLAVVLVDPEAGFLGVAHAGWRGALAQLPAKLARRMAAEGAKPSRMQALLSPCLGPGRLELAEEQWWLFQASDAGWRNYCSDLRQGHFKLDLWTNARKQLEEAGLAAGHIQGQEIDTYSHPELFYSHRRDQGQTGRMLTAAWLL